MTSIKEGTLLWKPTESQKKQSKMFQYMNWVNEKKRKIVYGLSFSLELVRKRSGGILGVDLAIFQHPSKRELFHRSYEP